MVVLKREEYINGRRLISLGGLAIVYTLSTKDSMQFLLMGNTYTYRLQEVVPRKLLTPILIRTFEVALMDPSIGTILDTFDDRQGLMIHAVVHHIWVFIQDGRPDKGPSLLRLDGQWAKFWKLCAATLFYIVEVHIERHDSYPGLTIELMADQIVMRLIVLTLFIPKKLQILRVLLRNVRHVCNAMNHLLGNSVIVARVLTPGVL